MPRMFAGKAQPSSTSESFPRVGMDRRAGRLFIKRGRPLHSSLGPHLERHHYSDAGPSGHRQDLDLITRQAFSYKRNGDGSFSLWSVGWNGLDENGRVEMELEAGDWVWAD